MLVLLLGGFSFLSACILLLIRGFNFAVRGLGTSTSEGLLERSGLGSLLLLLALLLTLTF